MSPIMVSQGESQTLAPAPEGLHQAVCVDVVDRGMVETQFGVKHKVDVTWQVVPFDDDGGEERDEEGHRFQVMQRYTASLHEKALLHQHLKAWRGKPFTKEELAAFDLEKLIGANAQIQVVHNLASNGKTYGNVQAIVPAGKKMTKLRPSEDYVRMNERAKNGNGNGHGHAGAVEDDDSDLPF